MAGCFTMVLALAAGLHAACHGAWKDSPSESFRPVSFMRELLIASWVGFFLCKVESLATRFVLLLTAYTLCRVATEFYKLFIRQQDQRMYRIPTQVHALGYVVRNPAARIMLGVGWIAGGYGLYCLVRLLSHHLPPHVLGAVAGLTFGVAVALCGAYKDGWVEGFYWRKFLKSPIAGLAAGFVVSFHTTQPAFLVLASTALERMVNELLFKLLAKGYVGGHFKSMLPTFPEWVARRHVFVAPYAATWVLLIALFLWRFFSPTVMLARGSL